MKFHFHELIGKGSYGKVYRATTEDKKVYAIKQLDLDVSQYAKICILNELRILATHACPFMVQFKTAFVDRSRIHLVTEFASRGDLQKRLAAQVVAKKLFSEDDIWHYMVQIVMAVHYLHRMGVVHRDLKPANIFLDVQDHVRLGDFGTVKLLRTHMPFCHTQIGTPIYMSPELYRRERYTAKTDVWSLGCILHELLTLSPAFYGANMMDLRLNVLKGCLVPFNQRYSQDIQALRNTLLCSHARTRPDLPTLVRIPCVQYQLAARNLCFPLRPNPVLQLGWVPPRKPEQWQPILDALCKVHTTVELRASQKEQLRALTHARKRIESACDAAPIHVSEQIRELERRLQAAREEVRRYEIQLHDLREDRLRRGASRPPLAAPPQTPPLKPHPPKMIRVNPRAPRRIPRIAA